MRSNPDLLESTPALFPRECVAWYRNGAGRNAPSGLRLALQSPFNEGQHSGLTYYCNLGKRSCSRNTGLQHRMLPEGTVNNTVHTLDLSSAHLQGYRQWTTKTGEETLDPGALPQFLPLCCYQLGSIREGSQGTPFNLPQLLSNPGLYNFL